METLSGRDSDNYEDYCFMCKEGGVLLMCDHSDCLKAYHTKCLPMDDKCIPESWYCGVHSCFICDKSSEFNCLCCTKALCRQCIVSAEFVQIREISGLCSVCLKHALYVEQKLTANSDMGISHFRNYWKFVKEKENLTVENLYNANVRMKSGQWYISAGFDSDEHDEHVKIKMRSEFHSIDVNKASWVVREQKAKSLHEDITKHVELEPKATSLQDHITKHRGDIVANGKGTGVPNLHSANCNDLETNNEFEDVLGDEGGRGSRSDSVNNMRPPVNSKRKKSGVENVLESVDAVVGDNLAENEDTTFAQSLDILELMSEEMEEINPLTSLYHFSQQFLLNKGNRTIFLKARTNRIRLASLQYNYQVHLHCGGI